MLASRQCYDPRVPSLTPDEVRRIAALARLDLNDSEVERLTMELAAILEYAAEVQRVDTEMVAADLRLPHAAAAAPGATTLRADQPAPSLPRAAILNDAPGADAEAGFFTVPRVLGA